MIRNCWYAAGFSEDFEAGAVHGMTIVGRPVVIWRGLGGRIAALDGRCAHKRFPLAEGRLLEGDVLECAYHGFCFDAEGTCVAIPALGDRQHHIPKTARQHVYPTVEQDGVVWLWPGEVARSGEFPPPPTPEIGSPEWETSNTEPMPVNANYRLLIENIADLTHFYPLHAGTVGTYEEASVPLEIEREVRGALPLLRMRRVRRNYAFAKTHRDRYGLEVGDRSGVHEIVGPCLIVAVTSAAPPGKLGTDEEQGNILYHLITPVDEENHIWRRSVCTRKGTRCHDDPSRSLLEVTVEGHLPQIAEDRWALEKQQEMLAFPDEGYREVHIKTDAAVVMARAMLDDMEAAEGYVPSGTASKLSSQPGRRHVTVDS